MLRITFLILCVSIFTGCADNPRDSKLIGYDSVTLFRDPNKGENEATWRDYGLEVNFEIMAPNHPKKPAKVEDESNLKESYQIRDSMKWRDQ